jgi:hypothetical protein
VIGSWEHDNELAGCIRVGGSVGGPRSCARGTEAAAYADRCTGRAVRNAGQPRQTAVTCQAPRAPRTSYLNYFSHGVRLSPLGTAATVWPIVPAPDDELDQSVE